MENLDYDAVLRLLDTWVGRAVVVSILPHGSSWYVATLAGRLPKRQDIDLEWIGDDLPDNSEGFFFTMSDATEGWLTVFQLIRSEFRDSIIRDDGSLHIDVRGALIVVEPQRPRKRRHH